MKLVLLAGGFGTRISEESSLKPKPMVEIGNMPILWHIMKIYSSFGINDFIICAGYKQHIIKEWFADYFLHTSDITFDFSRSGEMIVHKKKTEPWRVTIVDTGLQSETGGRLKRVKDYVGNETFMLTYGDAVGDVDINQLLKYHQTQGKIATVSVFNFSQNKGVLEIGTDGIVNAFREKSTLDGNLINIGFFVFEPRIFDFIPGDETPLEGDPLVELVKKRELSAYTHTGFWQCMDTLREKQTLEKLWDSGKAPWKIWED